METNSNIEAEKQNVAPKKKDQYIRRDVWDILFRIYHLYGWRVVFAADAFGTKCPCVLIPMDANGISFMDDEGTLPYMRFSSFPYDVPNKSGFFQTIHPYVPKVQRDKLVEKGLWSDEKRWTRVCGGIRLRKFVTDKALVRHPNRRWRAK